MVLPDSDGVSRVPPYSGSWTEETTFRLQDDCLLWSIFPDRSATLSLGNSNVQSYNPKKQASWFGLFPLRSPLLWESNFFLFLRVLRCFSSPRLPSTKLWIHLAIKPHGFGFPHSEISGSLLTYSLPKLIAVSHVLHRLLVPRHPPCALNNLTSLNNLSYEFAIKN